jgi:putative copper export protein/nitrogen fixation protein FixH
VLLAAATMRFLVLRAPPRGSDVVLPIAWAMAAAGLVMVGSAESSAAGVSLGTLLSSATGGPLIRQGIAIAATGVAVVASRLGRSDPALGGVGIGSAVALAFHAAGGHAGASESLWPVAVFVQWLHLIGVGVWIGGLVWLLVELAAPTEDRDPDDRDARIRRFSAVAGVALGAVLVSGALRSVDLLGGWTAFGRLLTTGWGNALVWKLALFSILAAFAAWNRYGNVRHLDERRASSVRRIVAGEALLAAGVFGVTGVLAGLPPASQLEGAAPARPPSVVASGSDFATTTRVRLVVTPGTAGPNRFDARVSDYDTGEPVNARRVALRFSLPERPDVGATTLELRAAAPGRWTAESPALGIEGRWEVVVVIETALDSTEVLLHVHTRSPAGGATAPPEAQRTTVSRAPGLPDVYTITLPDGSSVQAYVDPARPGPADVHFTAFDAGGTELPLASASAVATSPSGQERLKLRRLSAGHYTGSVELTQGPWSFEFEARARSGETVTASFEQEVG